MRYRLVASTPASEGSRVFHSDHVYTEGDRFAIAGEVWRVADAQETERPDVRRLVCVPDDGDPDRSA